MSHLDILFWLLVVLLAAVAFAIEAGAAARNRRVVLCTLFSVSASVLYIMFLVDDRTSMLLDPYVEEQKKNKKGKPAAVAGPDKGGAPGEAELQRKGGASDGREPDGAAGAGELAARDGEKPAGADDHLEPIFADCERCPSMVLVKPGQVVIGSPASEPGRHAAEGPQRRITLAREFAVGRFELTRDQFAYFVEETRHAPTSQCLGPGKPNPRVRLTWQAPGFEQAPSHPVVCVGEADVEAYLAWLSRKTGRTYRLLSESEWEFVARGGATTPYVFGDKLPPGPSLYNFNRVRDGTTPAAFSGPNGFGVYDVHGNAAERVAGCWTEDLQPLPANGAATPPAEGLPCRTGVVRGGSWAEPMANARSAARAVLANPAIGYNWVGFRVMREVSRSRRPEPETAAAEKSSPHP